MTFYDNVNFGNLGLNTRRKKNKNRYNFGNLGLNTWRKKIKIDILETVLVLEMKVCCRWRQVLKLMKIHAYLTLKVISFSVSVVRSDLG